MKTHVQKWGHSLAVRIPKSFAAALGFSAGGPAEMTLEDGAIVLKPGRDRVEDLDRLLEGVTQENTHPAWREEEAAGGVRTEGDEDETGL